MRFTPRQHNRMDQPNGRLAVKAGCKQLFQQTDNSVALLFRLFTTSHTIRQRQNRLSAFHMHYRKTIPGNSFPHPDHSCIPHDSPVTDIFFKGQHFPSLSDHRRRPSPGQIPPAIDPSDDICRLLCCFLNIFRCLCLYINAFPTILTVRRCDSAHIDPLPGHPVHHLLFRGSLPDRFITDLLRKIPNNIRHLTKLPRQCQSALRQTVLPGQICLGQSHHSASLCQKIVRSDTALPESFRKIFFLHINTLPA